MLSLRGLGVAYPGQTVLADLTAELGPGLVWVVGDEMSGKTSLLKRIAGVLAGAGTIAVDGVELAAAGPRPVAWCDAADPIHDDLPIADFVDRLRRLAPAFDAGSLARHVDGFGLRPHWGKTMFQLSTGTRRKVGLAGTLAMSAPVTLLDDPAAALDGPSVAHLMRTLADAAREPVRTCLVTAYAVPAGFEAAQVLRLPAAT